MTQSFLTRSGSLYTITSSIMLSDKAELTEVVYDVQKYRAVEDRVMPQWTARVDQYHLDEDNHLVGTWRSDFVFSTTTVTHTR